MVLQRACLICAHHPELKLSNTLSIFRTALAALHYNENANRMTTGYDVHFPKQKQGEPAVKAHKEKPTFGKSYCLIKKCAENHI